MSDIQNNKPLLIPKQVAQKERPVTFCLTQGNEILLGTDFLATFKAKLELDYTINTFSLKV
jgi:hypothetical protein